MLVFQMGQPRLREVKSFAQGNTAGELRSCDLYRGQSGSKTLRFQRAGLREGDLPQAKRELSDTLRNNFGNCSKAQRLGRL